MLSDIKEIINKPSLEAADLKKLLSVNSEEERSVIIEKAAQVRSHYAGNEIYLRGLIEYSNKCQKNCLYCGIRASNLNVSRFSVDFDQVLQCAEIAWKSGYGSIVLQSGERSSKEFVNQITDLLYKIKKLSNGELGITLSCGEQSRETYQQWFEAGAHRYLLRFESANQDLYYQIHPDDKLHSFSNRMIALKNLRDCGYQVGSGMMIGLPGQSVDHLVDDLLLLKQLDVDMVGMGPYIEHPDTPLFRFSHLLDSEEERFRRSILTIAVLRIFMKDINIASSTALDSLDPQGREKAIVAGANVLMPNITPVSFRENYFLYDKKPYLTEADELVERFKNSDLLRDFSFGYGVWGDSRHFSGS